jgi:ABC-type multidrug transport system permease subunit
MFSNYGDAMHGAIGSFLPIMFLSGIIWPLEGLPQILQKISWYLPLTAAVQAMRGVMARGWNISHSSVYAGIGITTAWISIFMTFSWIAMKIRTK